MEEDMSKILIIEDEVAIADLEKDYLELSDFEVDICNAGDEGLETALAGDYNLVILDLMLPGIDGFEVCRKIREEKNIPIIMVSAKKDDIDKIRGLGLGADDYMTKPFLPLEMVARVKAQLRRYKRYNTAEEREEDVVAVSGLVLNSKTHECFLNEHLLNLTPTEFAILRILCTKKGQVVSAEELFHLIWADEYYTKNNNTITVHIRHLREKMGDSFENPKYIKTVWGCGYRIEG